MNVHEPLRRLCPVILLLGALAGCSKPATESGSQSASALPALPKVRFKTDWYPQGEHGGFYQAQAKGFYKDAGVEVEIVPGGPGVLVTQLLLSGQVDMAMARSDDMIVNVERGLPFVVVGVYMEHDPEALLLHDEDPAKSFADLNNRTIMATPGVYWMDYLRRRYHLELREIPLNYGIAQFLADKTFIQQCFLTNEPYFVMKNGGHPRVLQLSESGYDPYRVIITTQAFLRKNPGAARAFVAASIRGWEDYMNGDPAPADAAILKLNPNMSDDFINFTMRKMREKNIVGGKPEAGERIGLMTRKRMQEQVDVLAELKLIPHPIPLESFVRFDLLPPDLQKADQ